MEAANEIFTACPPYTSSRSIAVNDSKVAITEVIRPHGTDGLKTLSHKETGGLPIPAPSVILLQVKPRATMLSRRIALFLVLLVGTAAAGWWWLRAIQF